MSTKLLLNVLLAILPSTLFAQSVQTLQIHGYGGWGTGKTDGNHYQWGNITPVYKHTEFTLALSSVPYDNINLVAQVTWKEGKNGFKTSLEYAFGEWHISDAFRLRLGRMKQPFGLYTEIFNVGTLRPFLLLPQGLYGANGFIGVSINGAGFTGSLDLGADWSLQYDIVGGLLENVASLPGVLSNNQDYWFINEIPTTFFIEDVIGGRLLFDTPVDGLQIGTSGYKGRLVSVSEIFALPFLSSRYYVYAAQGEYAALPLKVQAEIARGNQGNLTLTKTLYVEFSYQLTSHWQLALRYDWMKIDIINDAVQPLPPGLEQLFMHSDFGLGINYWINPSFVLKLGLHENHGNRYAFPDDPEKIMTFLTTGFLEKRTRLVQFGAQFSF